MAKRKKAKTTKRRTIRRSVGAIDKTLVNNILFAAIGGVAGKVVNNVLGNISITSNPKTDAQIKSALPLVGGAVVAATMGKKDSKMMFLGLGMAAYGATALATELGIMNGLDNMIAGYLPNPQPRYLNGYESEINYSTRVAAMSC